MCEITDQEIIVCRPCRCGENRRQEFSKRLDGLQYSCRKCQYKAAHSRQHAADRRFAVIGKTKKWPMPSYTPEARLKQVFRRDLIKWLAGLSICHPEWLADYERVGRPPGPTGRGWGTWMLAGKSPAEYKWQRWEEINGFEYR